MTLSNGRVQPRRGERLRPQSRDVPVRKPVTRLPVLSVKGCGSFNPRSSEERALIVHLECDPAVRRYERAHVGTLVSNTDATIIARLPAFYVDGPDGRTLAIAVAGKSLDERTSRALRHLRGVLALKGASLNQVSYEFLFSQPRWANMCSLFSCRFTSVKASDRLAICAEINRQGSLELEDCAALVRTSKRPCNVVLAMIVDGTLEINLDEPIMPHSLLKLSTAATSPSEP